MQNNKSNEIQDNNELTSNNFNYGINMASQRIGANKA